MNLIEPISVGVALLGGGSLMGFILRGFSKRLDKMEKSKRSTEFCDERHLNTDSKLDTMNKNIDEMRADVKELLRMNGGG